MGNDSLFDRCRVNTNIKDDVFVGIQRREDRYEVNFPLGYHLNTDEKGLRKDILLLINTLAANTDKMKSEMYMGLNRDNSIGIPVQAYLFLIKDFFEEGYYKERETVSRIAKRGKVDWRRTVKTQKSLMQENEAYYLDFVVRKNTLNENELITIIHKYCVYESFEKFGWLFTSFVPLRPHIELNKKKMAMVVKSKLGNTFNDRNKQLFRNMLAVICSMEDGKKSEFRYGTYRFEYVWEKMVDRAFGIVGKEEYFPRTTWRLANESNHSNTFLKPDSIMILNGKVYVLDSKYYKYGVSKLPEHLPGSSSVHKQITYGEYIAGQKKFYKNGVCPTVFNAFITPYDSMGETFPAKRPIYYIGMAQSDWKSNDREYEKVVGVLMDTKYLMSMAGRMNESEITKLADLIEKAIRPRV